MAKIEANKKFFFDGESPTLSMKAERQVLKKIPLCEIIRDICKFSIKTMHKLY